jgi:glycosyltransferase involved in cell wall biosynthesis
MTRSMKVFCYAAGKTSLYIPLLFGAIRDRYEPLLGADATPAAAIACLRRGETVLMHIHWEEFILQKCRSVEEAKGAALLFEERMREFRRLGGRTFWTVHNLVPHRVPYLEQFLDLRRFLAGFCDSILVHNASAIPALQGQAECPESRIGVLPHPSYVGFYETEAQAEAGIGAPAERALLCFGSVRRQKGFGRFIDMLPAEFLAARAARIRVSGTGPEAEQVRAAHAHRSDVQWDLRYVPMEEAPGLIRSSACVALPYENFLTSGVALLVMSVGGLLLAADAPQFREILPPENHRFLYRPGDAADLRRAVEAVLALGSAERAELCRANFRAARRFDPHLVGERLAALYAGAVAALGEESVILG